MKLNHLKKFGKGITFGGVLYSFYRYLEIKRFDKQYDNFTDKKTLLFNIHNKKNFYNENLISFYEKFYKINKLRKELLQFCEGNVLESGVGSSRNLVFYPKKKNLKVTAIDYSPNALEVALSKSKFIDINYELQDSENLNFKDNSFDTIVDTFSLEYYNNPSKVWEEFHRVAKPNSKILIISKGMSNKNYMNYYNSIIEKENIFKKGHYLTRDWKKIIENQKGFKIWLNKQLYDGSIYFYIISNQK